MGWKKNIAKMVIPIVAVLPLTGCFGYKVVKEEKAEKAEKADISKEMKFESPDGTDGILVNGDRSDGGVFLTGDGTRHIEMNVYGNNYKYWPGRLAEAESSYQEKLEVEGMGDPLIGEEIPDKTNVYFKNAYDIAIDKFFEEQGVNLPKSTDFVNTQNQPD